MYPAIIPRAWEDDGISDPPSSRSSNDPPDHFVHNRSRSTQAASNPKRISVFGGRSRSNTTTSFSNSSRRSQTFPTSGEDSTQDERAISSLGMRSEKSDRSRSFLSRGSRILRRQGSKINIVATLDEEEELEREKEKEKEKPRSESIFSRRERQVDNNRLKNLISDPFDFHHLTHTSPSHFESLNQARETDLVTEFSVIRASQRPATDLKGIRADDINFTNYSAGNFATAITAAGPTPKVEDEAVSPKSHPRRAQRESRIYENFSRPVPRYPRSNSIPCVQEAPAENEFAEPAPRAIDEILGLATTKTYPEDIEATHPSALQFSRTPSMNSHYELEDVPEEDEAIRYCHQPIISHVPTRIPMHAKQLSTGSHLSSKSPLSVFVAKQLSRQFSEVLGSPTLPQNLQLPQKSPNVTSPLSQFSYEDEMCDSWDADIDFCYENAAESTSDFDWSSTPRREAQRSQIGMACTDNEWLSAPKYRHLQPSPLSTSTLPTPDLESSPSLSTASHSASTPSMEYQQHLNYFQPVPSVLSKQILQENLYDEYIGTDAESDRHFPFPPGVITSENHISPRCSFSPISKCNSQESLMLSRAASVVRKHRSSVSTTSVPELVHSLHSLSSSRELMPTDRISAGEALVAGAGANIVRPSSSSQHRQTKSLETHLLLREGSNSSLGDSANPTPSLRDRSKSISEMQIKGDGPLLPPPPKNPNRKKTRATSYSLFPSAH
ncbi:hypothetical protein N7495_008959 [Penicillium taxi]|uniref:uncharacterized protein n=1 Tax=Penicillium taxi TaxID=168475 RepID=UPI0025457D4E|nr:uncharacterized protein N7495_008959 [Penicillium taxi]KAJ5888918.1 hypothetical protein N7495_008959 [Penicillium taxi]